MRKILLFNSMFLFFNTAFGQISFEDKVNIYDYDSLSVNIIYDDFDNDGDLDIIKNPFVNSGSVLLQKNENGDFNASPAVLKGTGKSPILSLDLNNDGFPDLITNSFNSISVLYNLQNDTFSEEVFLQNFNGLNSNHPIKFDYNSDGFMDLILMNNSNDAYVFFNNQMGGFEPAEFIIPVDTFDRIYEIHDFNNDGNFDIYIRDGNKLRIYLYDVENDEIDENDDFIQPLAFTQSSLISFGIEF